MKNTLTKLGVVVCTLLCTAAHAHNAEVTRKTICDTTDQKAYFLKMKGADFGTPEIGDRYVKVWREQAGVDVFTIEDPMDTGGLNSGLCTCSASGELSCD